MLEGVLWTEIVGVLCVKSRLRKDEHRAVDYRLSGTTQHSHLLALVLTGRGRSTINGRDHAGPYLVVDSWKQVRP
jgi:hypothetical protein